MIRGCVPAALHAHSSRGKGGFEISCRVHLPKTPLKRLSVITTTTTPLSDHSGLHIFFPVTFPASVGWGWELSEKQTHPPCEKPYVCRDHTPLSLLSPSLSFSSSSSSPRRPVQSRRAACILPISGCGFAVAKLPCQLTRQLTLGLIVSRAG